VAERSGGANKDTLCKFFLSTGCKFGASCHFRHVGRERRRSRSRERRSRSRSFDREPIFSTVGKVTPRLGKRKPWFKKRQPGEWLKRDKKRPILKS